MAVNKVVYNGRTLVDLTEDTVSAENTLSGVIGHGADGKAFTGAIPKVAGGVIMPGEEAQVAAKAGSYLLGDIVVAAASGRMTEVVHTPSTISQEMSVSWPKDTLPKYLIVIVADTNTTGSSTSYTEFYSGLYYDYQTPNQGYARMCGLRRKVVSLNSGTYGYYAIGPSTANTSVFTTQKYQLSGGVLTIGMQYCYFMKRPYRLIGVYA